MREALKQPSKWQRADTTYGFELLKDHVNRTGGDSGAGIISRFSVITTGEAFGHELWIDKEFLNQTTEAINATGPQGIKSRFTHPGLSGDGLGTFLGRVKDAKTVGEQVFADLHISNSAHEAPGGNLAEYIMTLAESDPDIFGTSIVFSSDVDAEQDFMSANKDKRGRFVSPDRNNKQNLVHTRLQDLRADDVVDEPASNPSGMFHRGDEIAKEAELMLDYAFGMTDQVPALSELDIHPERFADYFKKYLLRRGLRVVSSSDVISRCKKARDETQPTP